MAKAAVRRVAAAVKFDWSGVPDRELLRRFTAEGDQGAFAALVRRHTNLVLGVCRRAVLSDADAEDACQAVFLVLARKAVSTRWQPSIANWLYTTARKVSRDARVAAARRAERESRVGVPEAVSPVDQMSGRELLDALDDELDQLPPIYREPLVLCYLEGLSREEAASRLAVPTGTVKIRLERARKRLADALTRRGVAAGTGLLTLAATSPAGAFPPRLLDTIVAAVGGSPSGAAAALAQGVTVTTGRTKLALSFALLAGVAVVGFGLAGAKPTHADDPPQPAPAPAEKIAQPAPKSDPNAVTFSGVVLGPDGKPLDGAKLFIPSLKTPEPQSEDDVGFKEVGRTDAEGRFRVSATPDSRMRFYLIAQHPGFGVDWVQYEPGETFDKPIELQLPEDVPITGRVLNTEGKPVAGVTVSIATVYVPKNGDLDAYLKGWLTNLRDTLSTPEKRLYLPPQIDTAPTTTDADGRFRLTGAGRDRIVYVQFSGSGIARTRPQVLTRPNLNAEPYQAELRKEEHNDLRVLNRFMGPMPPDFTLVAEPGRVVQGTITNAATGKPVLGCGVSTSTGWGDAVVAKTDAEGKYKLVGVPKNSSGYRVSLQPAKDSGLMSTTASVVDTVGVGSVTIDAKLSPGAVVVGQVIDKATGKGVRAHVRLAPLADNKFFDKAPGSDSYRYDRTMKSTDADGKFRLVTIPGKSLLLVQVSSDLKFDGQYVNPYRRATPEPKDKDLFTYDADDDEWRITTAGNSLEFLGLAQAAKVIDVKTDGETAVELNVDAGVTGTIEIRDNQGKPLDGAYVSGLAASWPIVYKLPKGSAPVYALDPDHPRTIAVMHPKKKLAGTAVIRGDEKGPVVVKLQAVGTFTGTFVEAGVPLAGAEVAVNAKRTVFSELYRFTVSERGNVTTDAKGRFTLPDIVPGMEFYFHIRKNNTNYTGNPKLGVHTLKAGEKKDIGKRVVEPFQ